MTRKGKPPGPDDESESTTHEERVHTAVNRVLDQPFAALTSTAALKILQDRLDSLAKYTQRGLPADVVDRYQRAIELTRMAESIANQCVMLTEMASRIPELDDDLLLILAKAKIDLDSEKIEARGGQALLQGNRALRDQVVGAILSAAGGQSYREIVDLAFAREDEFKRMNAFAQATMLIAVREQLGAQRDLALVPLVVSPVWRQIFYTAILEDVGSDLQKRTKRDKEVVLLKELLMTLVGKITHFDLLDVAKDLLESATLLSSKKAEEEMITDLAAKHQLACEYADLYSTAVVSWAQQGSAAIRVLTENVVEFLKLFQILTEALQNCQRPPPAQHGV